MRIKTATKKMEISRKTKMKSIMINKVGQENINNAFMK